MWSRLFRLVRTTHTLGSSFARHLVGKMGKSVSHLLTKQKPVVDYTRKINSKSEWKMGGLKMIISFRVPGHIFQCWAVKLWSIETSPRTPFWDKGTPSTSKVRKKKVYGICDLYILYLPPRVHNQYIIITIEILQVQKVPNWILLLNEIA